jgi:hypothetical protein
VTLIVGTPYSTTRVTTIVSAPTVQSSAVGGRCHSPVRGCDRAPNGRSRPDRPDHHRLVSRASGRPSGDSDSPPAGTGFAGRSSYPEPVAICSGLVSSSTAGCVDNARD